MAELIEFEFGVFLSLDYSYVDHWSVLYQLSTPFVWLELGFTLRGTNDRLHVGEVAGHEIRTSTSKALGIFMGLQNGVRDVPVESAKYGWYDVEVNMGPSTRLG